MRPLPALLAAISLAAGLHAQTLWTVDAAGGGDFVEIQNAIDAASSGDTLLLRAGRYDEFVISAKSLTLIVDPGAAPELSRAPAL